MKKNIKRLYRNLREVAYYLGGKPKGVGYILMMHHILPEGSAGMPQERYLNILPDSLEQFIKEASKEYDFIALEEVPQRIKSPGKRKFLVFTMDDGCESVYTYGLPIFTRYQVPFTVFVTTSFVGGKCDNSEIQTEKESAMSWHQLQVLRDNPLVTIGGHTATHPKLAQLTAHDVENEITTCCKSIKEHLQIDITTFAYPFGSCNDAVLDTLRKQHSEITLSVLATGGVVSTDNNDQLQLPRWNLSDSLSVADLRHWRGCFMGLK